MRLFLQPFSEFDKKLLKHANVRLLFSEKQVGVNECQHQSFVCFSHTLHTTLSIHTFNFIYAALQWLCTSGCILGSQCIINHIKLLLWDRDQRSYSYYVEVSLDREDWVRVADHGQQLCRAWQRLYFPTKVVKSVEEPNKQNLLLALCLCAACPISVACRYIRVVGTHNTVNRVFHLISLEAYYTTQTFTLDKDTGLLGQFECNLFKSSLCLKLNIAIIVWHNWEVVLRVLETARSTGHC